MKPFPWKCGHCRERSVGPVTLPHYRAELEHDGRSYMVEVANFPVLQCARCQTILLDDAANRILSAELRKAAGVLSPEELERSRLALNLSQHELAGYLQVPESTLSRWEGGDQIQQRCLDALLRGFFEVESFRSMLMNGVAVGVQNPMNQAQSPAPSQPVPH